MKPFNAIRLILLLISKSLVIVLLVVSTSNAASAARYATPQEAVPHLSLASYKTPIERQNEIFSNGNMQSPIIVNYVLGPDFVNPKISIKESLTHRLLPFNGWGIENNVNKLAHYISNTAPKVRRGKKRAIINKYPTKMFYITNNTGHPDNVDVCAEITVTHRIDKSEITRSTCDSNTDNGSTVSIKAEVPPKYNSEDFMLFERRRTKSNTGIYVKYYELITWLPSTKFSLINSKQLNVRKPNNKGLVDSIPYAATLRFSDPTETYYLEALDTSTMGYGYNNAGMYISTKTYISPDPEETASKPLLKFVSLRQGEATKGTWPDDGINRLANSIDVTFLDGYGNPLNLNLTVSDSRLYLDDEYMW
ncbi:hypothetical protein L1D61_18760 [Vibrio mediterranei]|nr:hypothetical protein [Vibrio mediterranei]